MDYGLTSVNTINTFICMVSNFLRSHVQYLVFNEHAIVQRAYVFGTVNNLWSSLNELANI